MKKKNSSLVPVLISLVALAIVIGGGFWIASLSGDDTVEIPADFQSQYPVAIDPNCAPGLLEGSDDTGEENPYGTISYKINGKPYFAAAGGAGTLMIENAAENQHYIKVEIVTADGLHVYASGYLPPESHIAEAPLALDLVAGSYDATAFIKVYDMDTLENIGQLEESIVITVAA